MRCYFHCCACQEARPSLADNEIKRRIEKRKQDQLRKQYIQQKGYKIVEMWECEWRSLYKTDAPVKSYLRANFSYKRPPSEEQLLQGIFDGRLLFMSHVILKCLNSCATIFPNFPQVSKILLLVEMISEI